MIRVRFAPSPTGYLHVGNARTALYNWLFARKVGGTYILRIEDTDVERSSKKFEDSLVEDLKWLGVEWDEGIGSGGDFGPYRQSERLDIYKEYCDKLIKEGKAYPCFCSGEELEVRRKEALKKGQTPRYDNRCRSLTDEEKKKFETEGRKAAVRFKVEPQVIEFEDMVRGKVSFDMSLFGDFIIMKSNSHPSFNFAVVVDDYLMKVTHVVRGEDHLSNTPIHILLFKTIGAPIPKFAHLSMIMGPDNTRLSKRHGAASVTEFKKMGYLPDGMINYLALLGWGSEDQREIFSREELISQFDLEKVSKSSSIFDMGKLNWVNGKHIRAGELDNITKKAKVYLDEAGYVEKDFEKLKKIVDSVREYLPNLSDIVNHVDIYFTDEVKFENAEAEAMVKKDYVRQVLGKLKDKIGKIPEITMKSLTDLSKEIAKETGIKGKELFMPIRVAMTGKIHGPELQDVLPIKGKDWCIKRIDKVLEVISSK